LFESAASRTEVICTFLALLELIRLRQLVCSQPEPFAEIEIRRAVAAGVSPAVEGGILPPGNSPGLSASLEISAGSPSGGTPGSTADETSAATDTRQL
jgi:hypothetical protein